MGGSGGGLGRGGGGGGLGGYGGDGGNCMPTVKLIAKPFGISTDQSVAVPGNPLTHPADCQSLCDFSRSLIQSQPSPLSLTDGTHTLSLKANLWWATRSPEMALPVFLSKSSSLISFRTGLPQVTARPLQLPSACVHTLGRPPLHAIEPQKLPSSPTWYTFPSGQVHEPPHDPIPFFLSVTIVRV